MIYDGDRFFSCRRIFGMSKARYKERLDMMMKLLDLPSR